MTSECCRLRQGVLAAASRFLAILVAVTCLGLPGGIVVAQDKKTAEKDFEEFNPKNFDRPTVIDNKWIGFNVGKQFVYEGTTQDGNERAHHRIVFTVTDLTKVIGGVRSVVVWAVDYKEGKLEETEIAFFAQDNDGNVWQMGEYPEEWESGKFAKAPAWIHGAEGARAGLAMQANPKTGTPSYSQGWGPKVGWTDRALVDQMGVKNCVRLACYEDVLVIAESSQAEGPNAQQLKYYAPGVGKIRVGWRGTEEKLQEVLELVKVEQLGPAAMKKAREEAMKLDKRAYKIAKKAYGATPPAEHRISSASAQ
jgi:hypothetical protein